MIEYLNKLLSFLGQRGTLTSFITLISIIILFKLYQQTGGMK
jgi:hypothetical protein